jgi:hypothetical protein
MQKATSERERALKMLTKTVLAEYSRAIKASQKRKGKRRRKGRKVSAEADGDTDGVKPSKARRRRYPSAQ